MSVRKGALLAQRFVPRSAKLGRSKGGNTQQQVSTAMAIPDADAGSSGVVMATGRYLRKRSVPAVRLRSVPSTRSKRHVPMPGANAAKRSCGRSWAALSRQRNRRRWHGDAIDTCQQSCVPIARCFEGCGLSQVRGGNEGVSACRDLPARHKP